MHAIDEVKGKELDIDGIAHDEIGVHVAAGTESARERSVWGARIAVTIVAPDRAFRLVEFDDLGLLQLAETHHCVSPPPRPLPRRFLA